MKIFDMAYGLFKVFRDHVAKLPDRKNCQQGIQLDAQSDIDGAITKSREGDEQGWGFFASKTFASGGRKSDLGTWFQATPALLKSSDSTIYPFNDKTLGLDSQYVGKTQSSIAGDSESLIRVASTHPNGTPGLVVTCMNDGALELIFLPISSFDFIVDNNSFNLSSEMHGTVGPAPGAKDPANIGKTDDLFYVEGNASNIKTAASFRLDATKKGQLDFENLTYPSITTPGTPANYEVKCVWNTGTSKWDWYAIGEATTNSIFYARIRWNYTTQVDLSEGELMNYDSGTDSFTATATKIWIDWKKSAQTKHWTAGTDTIFVVRLLTANVTRLSSDTRDLYYAYHCINDQGKRISHFQVNNIGYQNQQVNGIPLSTDVSDPVWQAEGAGKIKTKIGVSELDNIMVARVPEEWKLFGSSQNYKYLELSDLTRGHEFWFRPIRPTLSDISNSLYDSAEELNSNTIATYERIV